MFSFHSIVCLLLMVFVLSSCKRGAALFEPQKGGSVATLASFTVNSNSIVNALEQVEKLPTREIIQFGPNNSARFAHDYIVSFSLVYDKQTGKASVEDVKHLLFVPGAQLTGVYSSVSDELWRHASDYVKLNAEERDELFFEFLVANKLGQAETRDPDFDDKTAHGTVYVVSCSGGSLDGHAVIANDPVQAGKAAQKCIDAGGCEEVCKQSMYMVPKRLTTIFGDFTSDQNKLGKVLRTVEKFNHEYKNKNWAEDIETGELDLASSQYGIQYGSPEEPEQKKNLRTQKVSTWLR